MSLLFSHFFSLSLSPAEKWCAVCLSSIVSSRPETSISFLIFFLVPKGRLEKEEVEEEGRKEGADQFQRTSTFSIQSQTFSLAHTTWMEAPIFEKKKMGNTNKNTGSLFCGHFRPKTVVGSSIVSPRPDISSSARNSYVSNMTTC